MDISQHVIRGEHVWNDRSYGLFSKKFRIFGFFFSKIDENCFKLTKNVIFHQYWPFQKEIYLKKIRDFSKKIENGELCEKSQEKSFYSFMRPKILLVTLRILHVCSFLSIYSTIFTKLLVFWTHIISMIYLEFKRRSHLRAILHRSRIFNHPPVNKYSN